MAKGFYAAWYTLEGEAFREGNTATFEFDTKYPLSQARAELECTEFANDVLLRAAETTLPVHFYFLYHNHEMNGVPCNCAYTKVRHQSFNCHQEA